MLAGVLVDLTEGEGEGEELEREIRGEVCELTEQEKVEEI